VKFIVDAQLPPLLASTLREAGHDAQALREIGLRHTEDNSIWKYALEKKAAILTKDEDFVERCIRSPMAPVIIWLRIGNATNPELLDWFKPRWSAILESLENGDRLIEVV
jgi:predicted nuclease of predicted toxin-antitoxin system